MTGLPAAADLASVTTGLDMGLEEDRFVARRRLAAALLERMPADALLDACRAHGVVHVRTGRAAAAALADVAVPLASAPAALQGRG